MKASKDQTRNISQEAIDSRQEIIRLYIKYWEEHILPIKEKQRQKAFMEILLSVAERLYGMEVLSEIGLRMFERGR